jgi:hypothetical protein
VSPHTTSFPPLTPVCLEEKARVLAVDVKQERGVLERHGLCVQAERASRRRASSSGKPARCVLLLSGVRTVGALRRELRDASSGQQSDPERSGQLAPLASRLPLALGARAAPVGRRQRTLLSRLDLHFAGQDLIELAALLAKKLPPPCHRIPLRSRIAPASRARAPPRRPRAAGAARAEEPARAAELPGKGRDVMPRLLHDESIAIRAREGPSMSPRHSR